MSLLSLYTSFDVVIYMDQAAGRGLEVWHRVIPETYLISSVLKSVHLTNRKVDLSRDSMHPRLY